MNITEIPTNKIRPFVSRARPKEPFERMKASIEKYGLKKPIQVKDISDLPPKERGKFLYELISGEGRLTAFLELGKKTIPAIIVKTQNVDQVGLFLAENIIRKNKSWLQKAKLMHGAIKEGLSVSEIAERFFVTEPYVLRCLKILGHASGKLLEKGFFETLSLAEAIELTTLPESGQEIVIEALQEEELPPSQIPALVKKAKEATEKGQTLRKSALIKSLSETKDALKEMREVLKLKRLHWALGPQNLYHLLQDEKFQKTCKNEGVSYESFINSFEKNHL